MKLFIRTTIIFQLFFILISGSLFAQQQVDVKSMEESYKGGFMRLNVGIAPVKFDRIESVGKESFNLIPISFDFVFGKRFNRNIAPYFRFGGHVLVKETTNFENFSEAGMNIGCNIYYRDPNTYISPEVGLAVVNYSNYTDDVANLGLDLGIRAGKDWHISGKFFIGTQLYLAYFYAWNQEDDFPKSSGIFYGVNLSIKYGK